MTTSFTAYIDESGDEGSVFLPGEKGSSRWLVLSGVTNRLKVVSIELKVISETYHLDP
jgi:Protein of unknown function (DUF3800)